MKKMDTFLQEWRYRVVAPYICSGMRVLDVGCFDGSMFAWFADKKIQGLGIDSNVIRNLSLSPHIELVEGRFPEDLPSGQQYDAITMLAVIEHVPADDMVSWVNACSELLVSGGLVLITAPSPFVDKILDVLVFLKIADGMALEEHHGFDPSEIPTVFGEQFELVSHKRFQCGLNNLFVLRKK